MRIYLFLFILVVVGCGVEEKPAAIDSDKGKFCSDVEKQALLKIIEGGWVNEKYIELFDRFQSPMTVASKELFLQQVAFDISNLSGDTLLNAIGRSNCNEGERFDVVFYKNQNGKTAMRLVETRSEMGKAFDLGYELKGKDTILVVTGERNNVAQTARFKRQFRQVFSADQLPVMAIEYYVNKNLFAGEWEMSGSTVSFSEKGEVKNFNAYRHYSVSTRDEEPASRPDEISFYNDTAGVTYAFTVKSNRIQLYELFHSEDGTEFSRGKMIGEMRRK